MEFEEIYTCLEETALDVDAEGARHTLALQGAARDKAIFERAALRILNGFEERLHEAREEADEEGYDRGFEAGQEAAAEEAPKEQAEKLEKLSAETSTDSATLVSYSFGDFPEDLEQFLFEGEPVVVQGFQLLTALTRRPVRLALEETTELAEAYDRGFNAGFFNAQV